MYRPGTGGEPKKPAGTPVCYVCQICRNAVPPNTKRLTHRVMRPSRSHAGLEIAQEFAVCGGCKASLDFGTPLAELLKQVASKGQISNLPPPVVPVSIAYPASLSKLPPELKPVPLNRVRVAQGGLKIDPPPPLKAAPEAHVVIEPPGRKRPARKPAVKKTGKEAQDANAKPR